ncbi:MULTISPECIES: ABC transporter ATP-binding protein [unclassified Haladaptatus]|uniref:ABC transporter ATP-binding protein n=1 Tax=unclassified Haladaptatus TaxID=2622732 RepID=UPI0023E88C15|nr:MULTISPECIES: ABC transporter ATP-binding protein [unclassified Haladaptatus]
MTALIETDGLTKYYGEVRGIEDLTFSVDEGTIFGFLGPNGAGKSTTIRTLLGLLHPSSGTARILGHDVTDTAALTAAKQAIGHIPGDFRFYRNTTGTRMLDYFARLRGDDRREELLSLFPIPEDRKVKTYSRGNRQKLAIVQAFMHNPRLVIMDEPTSGLDPLVQERFYDFLREEQAAGVTTFFSTHILSEVRKICEEVAIIRDGRLVALEDIDALLAKSGKVVRVSLEESVDPSEFLMPGIARTELDEEGYLRLIVTENYDGLIDELARYTVRDLDIRETSVEDVFMHFYDGDTGA